MTKYNCNSCKDAPYEIGYVDIGVGNYEVPLMWTCSYCCGVDEGKWTRKAANRAIIRDRTRCMMRKIKNRIKHPFGMKITEEDEIPF